MLKIMIEAAAFFACLLGVLFLGLFVHLIIGVM